MENNYEYDSVVENVINRLKDREGLATKNMELTLIEMT